MMKTKKFLILPIVLMITMFLTGCYHGAEEKEIKEMQQILVDFSTTKAYLPPNGYKISYEGEKKDKIYIYNDRIGITFASNSIVSMNIDGNKIDETEINIFKEIRNDFLNVVGYEIPEGYNINKYQDEDKIEIKNDCISITFSIAEDKIIKVSYYTRNEISIILFAILVIVIIFGGIIRNTNITLHIKK